MGSKKGEIQQKIAKALKLIQSSNSTDKELVEIKLFLEQNVKEAFAVIKKNLHRVPGKELHYWLKLIKFLGGKGVVPAVKELFYREDVDLSLRKEIAKILVNLHSDLPSQVNEQFRIAQVLYTRLSKVIKSGRSESIESRELDEFQELPEFLQISLLNQLLAEKGERSLPLLDRLFGLSKQLNEFLINKLGEIANNESAEILNVWLDKSKDKAQKKLIKKSLYKLKLKGLEPKPTSHETKTEPLKFDIPTEDIAYVSHIDTRGERFLLLAREHAPAGLEVFQVFISSEKGIFKIDTAEMRRRDFRSLIRKMEDERKIMLIRMELDYCHFLIEEAVQINSAGQYSLPDGYEKLKNWLRKPVKIYSEPLIYHFLSLQSLGDSNELVEKSAELLKVEPFKSWMLPPEEVEDPAEELKEAVDSRLLLTPIQQKERVNTIYCDVAEKYFNSQRRKMYRRYMEEIAYILVIKRKKEAAKITLATALAIEKQAPFLIPFVIELVKRSIFTKAGFAPKDDLIPEGKKDSRIVLPSEEPKSEKQRDSRIITSPTEGKSERREDSGLIVPPGEIKGR